jgi:hypothetical protein
MYDAKLASCAIKTEFLHEGEVNDRFSVDRLRGTGRAGC